MTERPQSGPAPWGPETSGDPSTECTGPLAGLRVLELGQLLAGPFCGSLLGYFGAEVIKVEPPGAGDPIRTWREVRDGTSLWWYSLARNKKSVTIDLRKPRGRELARHLAVRSDIIIENFRPGTLERWGLGPEDIRPENPGVIYARISGYGQSGPYRDRPGFASVSEGFSGFRSLNGYPGMPPVRPNLSLGDSLSGLHAAFGVLMAVIERQKSGRGQSVDVALYESMFNLLEAVVPEFDGAGIKRQPSGSTITGIVPSNTYHCADGKYIIIGGNTESIYRRLMTAVGREDLASDSRLQDNSGRVLHQVEIDAALAEWCAARDSESALAVLMESRVPSGPIYDIEDMMNDPHYRARGLFETVEIDGKPLCIPAMTPRLDRTPGCTLWPGVAAGHHNQEVFSGLLGLGEEELRSLAADQII